MSETVEQEIMINAPIAKVWEAITKPEHIANWFGCNAEFELVPGAKGRFVWENFEAPLTIVSVEKPRLFTFRWISADTETQKIDGETLVTFTLSGVDGGTMLRVVESGFEELALTSEEKDALRGKHTGGWDVFIGNIKKHVSSL